MLHRYKLGDRVGLAFGFHDQDAIGLYEVTAILPTRPDGEPQYRVKGSDDRERVIGEKQIGAPTKPDFETRAHRPHNPITKELDRLREATPPEQQPLSRGDLPNDKLYGAPVYDASNKKIGAVVQIHGVRETLPVIIDIGGFLGIGARSIALRSDEISFSRADDGSILAVTRLDEIQLKERATHMET